MSAPKEVVAAVTVALRGRTASPGVLQELADAAFAASLEWAADEVARLAAERYPTDVFIPPTPQDFVEINALLRRERGHMLDGVAAEATRRGHASIATTLREYVAGESR